MNIKIQDIKDLQKTGIYKITNITNHKVYVGSTWNSFKMRFKKHYSSLKRGAHKNTHLQNSWNKHGENSFVFEVIEIIPKENKVYIREREQYYIDNSKCLNPQYGFNIDPKVDRSIRNEETNRKISETLKRKYASGEITASHRECIYKGKKRPEHGLKMRGNKTAVEISNDSGVICIFRGQLDIQEYTSKNIIPGTVLTPHSQKGFYISKKMIAKYVNTGKKYKGLYFNKIRPLPLEIGAVKWVNCWKPEMVISSQAEGAPSEGSETTGEV